MTDAPPRRVVAIFAAHALPHVGGVELYVDGLLRRLAARGWSFVIVSSGVGADAPDATAGPTRVLRLPSAPLMAGRLPVPYPGLALFRALRALRAARPASVITNTRFQPLSWLGAAFARASRIPHLHIEHGSGHVPMSGAAASWFSRTLDRTAGAWVVRGAARSVGVSEACASFLRQLGARDPGVLFSGVDRLERDAATRRAERERLGVGPDEPVVLYAGRITDDKGVPLLVEAFRGLPASARAHLVLAGDGNALERVRAAAAGAPSIHLLGRLAPGAIPALLAASDIFAHPSLCSEGLPRAVLEAAAGGLAIVATPQGGTREVIRTPAEGVLVPPGDAGALASALARLVASPAERAALGAAARLGVADRFEWDRIASQAEALLLGLSRT